MQGYEYRHVLADEGRLFRVKFISSTHYSEWHPASAEQFTALQSACVADYKLGSDEKYLPVRSGFLDMPKKVGNMLGLPLNVFSKHDGYDEEQFHHISHAKNGWRLAVEGKAR